MPRPGPRPYECVRRAWHSDRHQPMRGSVIQQIFKVVYENHSAVTKKNKEWQEKLPIVVFKAEEIMYSKANSQADYMASETLWDRVNDAIDTIIRKDESAETGGLLPPCVEAALNLGCIPVRASRSQRHSNHRTYLNPKVQESGVAASKILTGSPTAHFALESNRHSVSNFNNPIASSYENASFHENDTSFDLGSVYPLYYGTNFQPEISRLGFQECHTSKDIIVGTPIFASFENHSKIGCLRTHLSGEDKRLPNRTKQPEFWEVNTEHPEVDCDLSLKLGLFSDSMFCGGMGSAHVTEGIGHSSSGEAVKIKANDPSRLRLGRYDMEDEDQNVEAFHRKRELPFHSNVDNSQIFWPIDPCQHHFYDQRKRQNS